MSESPIELRHQLQYQIVMFIIVVLWGIMGFDVANGQLLYIYNRPFGWVAWSLLLIMTAIPVVLMVSWKMKTNITYSEPVWEFRERDVSIAEFESMMKQYKGVYQHILSTIDYPRILIVIVLILIGILFPFFTMRTTYQVIAATPVVFGLLVVLVIILFANTSFKYYSNEATPHFPYHSSRRFRRYVELMNQSPGISWAGIHITIGWSGGYFTIRKPKPIARIEEIESVGRVECQLSDSGTLNRIITVLQNELSEEAVVCDETPTQLSPYIVAQIVHRTLLAYIDTRGERELLGEVLEEIEDYLKQFSPASQTLSPAKTS